MAQATKSRASSTRNRTTKRKATKARKPSAAHRQSRNGAASNGTAHEVAQATAHAAKKARTPLIAGGAAVAGAAGGLALGARQARKSKAMRRPVVKVDSRDLTQAAKNVGRFGVEMGELASELRKNREETDSSRRRSPIEVVLQGLTTRRS